MGFRLVLLDLDGTLLTSERRIRDESVRALARVMQAGVRVAFSTGRMPASTRSYVDVVKPNAPSIHYNGAMVRDAASGRIIVQRTVPLALATLALRTARGLTLHENVYVGDRIWVDRTSKTSTASERKDGVPHTRVDDIPQRLLDEGVDPTKIMFITEPERIPALDAALASALQDRAARINSEPEYLEVLPPGCSKRWAAEELARHLGIGLHEVMAFGDNKNDLELLEACGLGVAMANSHAEVLARVRVHIGDNDSDAIARFLDGCTLDSGALSAPAIPTGR